MTLDGADGWANAGLLMNTEHQFESGPSRMEECYWYGLLSLVMKYLDLSRVKID